MLTGQSKTDYQRAYMRARRSNKRSNAGDKTVRPIEAEVVRPITPSDVTPIVIPATVVKDTTVVVKDATNAIPINPQDGLPYSEDQWAYIQSKAR